MYWKLNSQIFRAPLLHHVTMEKHHVVIRGGVLISKFFCGQKYQSGNALLFRAIPLQISTTGFVVVFLRDGPDIRGLVSVPPKNNN